MSESGQNLKDYQPSHLARATKTAGHAVALRVVDIETTKEYNFASKSEAARFLNVDVQSIQRYCRGDYSTKPFNQRYVIRHGESIDLPVDISSYLKDKYKYEVKNIMGR